MEVKTVLALIDKNIDYLDELYKEFNVLLSKVSAFLAQIEKLILLISKETFKNGNFEREL